MILQEHTEDHLLEADYIESVANIFWIDFFAACSEQEKRLCKKILKNKQKPFFTRMIAFSHFAKNVLVRHPQKLHDFFALSDLEKPLDFVSFNKKLVAISRLDEIGFAQGLRNLKQLLQLRFIYQQLNSLVEFETQMREMSRVADAFILTVLDWHYEKLSLTHGFPIHNKGKKQHLYVLAMGKLGAQELNLSSDIDLIFAFPEAGTVNAENALSHQEFFSILAQKVIATLNKQTADGYIYRVDMRLRPFGSSGQLVSNFQALEHYYFSHGREWERYALIKARVIDQDAESEVLMQHISPFIYRKYIDYSAVEALREMKVKINREIRRSNMKGNIKLNAGGIREIEFIVQVYQLIYGGLEVNLQQPSLLKVLKVLYKRAIIKQTKYNHLKKAYIFLRQLEHALQAVDDQQAHTLPDSALAKKHLAWMLGFKHFDELYKVISHHQKIIRSIFNELIQTDQHGEEESKLSLQPNWHEVLIDQWQKVGFSALQVSPLRAFLFNKKIIGLKPIVKRRLICALSKGLEFFEQAPTKIVFLESLVDILNSVINRSIYLTLISENPEVIGKIVLAAKRAPLVYAECRRYPVLLDDLIHQQPLSTFSNLQNIKKNLQELTLRIAFDDLEQHMQSLRYFKMALYAQIALAEVDNKLPLFCISSYLSHVAEAILDYTLNIAWEQLVARYGHPTSENTPFVVPPFAIVAYGKLGGEELSYQSDLDLVFLYDAPLQALTDGDKPIENATFFIKLGQRIIHILSTQTVLGRLYEVDMRLRPSGNKGLLVSSLKAFGDYQQNKAWVWEQQALVRAKVVAGSEAMSHQFAEIRHTVLAKVRQKESVSKEVVSMRERMHRHFLSKKALAKSEFDLKQSIGGIVDIEFMVQYCVLVYASQYNELLEFTDNLRLLELMADLDLIANQDRLDLVAAYQAYRSLGHSLALNQKKAVVKAELVNGYAEQVQRIWQVLLGRMNH